MKLLLDTHVAIWLSEGSKRLAPAVRRTIERATRVDGVTISSISFWEVGILAQKGRVTLPQRLAPWRTAILSQPGVDEVPVSSDIAIEAIELPGSMHGDPADRLIVATARITGARLVTADERIVTYGRQGHVIVLEA